jgi:paraquat-inducible protein A
MTLKNNFLMICHECDALQDVSHIPEGNVGLCARCGERLFKNPKSAIEKPLAILIACLILFVVANIYPIMRLNVFGIEHETTLSGAALVFFNEGRPDLAIIVWFTSVLLPGFSIFSLCYILTSIHLKKCWPFTRYLLLWVSRILPWCMMDVFLLAILVALVKLSSSADLVLGLGFTAFVALILFYAAAMSSIEMHALWKCLDITTLDKASLDKTSLKKTSMGRCHE